MALEPAPGGALQSQESLLLDYVHRLDQHKEGRRAAHIHISRLQAENRREHHVRVAASTFEPLVDKLQGQLFVLKNSDLFFIFKAESFNDVETVLLKLKFLFSDDALLADNPARERHADGGFTTFYEVESDYPAILNLVRSLVHAEQAGGEGGGGEDDEVKAAIENKQDGGQQLTPRLLGRIAGALQRADITNMMRRQFVCGLVGEASPQPLFSELFIAISDLRDTLMPGVNLASSPWLFQHLTEILDKRMLAMLVRSTDRSITGDISINLNLSTLLSPEFLYFDDNVIAAMRGSVVIELQKMDIFADLNAYLFARDFAKDRGYRICIDGLTHQTLPFVDRERLGADMIKLIWTPGIKDEISVGELGELVKGAGVSKVVLCRCDDDDAVKFGQQLGIGMFQGRHIENLIAEDNRRRDMDAVRRRGNITDIIE